MQGMKTTFFLNSYFLENSVQRRSLRLHLRELLGNEQFQLQRFVDIIDHCGTSCR